MSPNYKLNHRLKACILIAILFLPSCTDFSDSAVASVEGSTEAILELTKRVDIKQLVDKELTAKGGHLVVCHERGEELEADVKMNVAESFSKEYKSLHVYIDESVNPSQLVQLDKKQQEILIEVQLPESGQLGYVYIGKKEPVGDMKERSKEKEKEKEQDSEKGRDNVEYLINYKQLRVFAEQEGCEAQFQLGQMAYETWQEQGRRGDPDEARVWLDQASSQGHEMAIALLSEINRILENKENEQTRERYKRKRKEEEKEEQKHIEVKRSKRLQKEEDADLEGCPFLAPELLQEILSYVPFPYILNCRRVNSFFYEVITGYSEIGMIGVTNKPRSSYYSNNWRINKVIDFRTDKLKILTPETIPSFLFYRLMNEVHYLPPPFWPHLAGTQIEAINMADAGLGPGGGILLARSLRGTNVRSIFLFNNRIGKGVVELAKALQGTNVRNVDLKYNEIDDIMLAWLIINLQGTSVQVINLSDNRIGDRGIMALSRKLQGTALRIIDLRNNQIGDVGVAALGKFLRGTNLCKIYLGNNQISGLGARLLGEGLEGTNLYAIDLSLNNIGTEIVEFIKTLQGTMVCDVDLSWNEIGSLGAAEIAKNLRGTNLRSIKLSHNKIDDRGLVEFVENLEGTNVNQADLSDNQIGDVGIVGSAEKLKGTSVQILNLAGNNISNRGAVEFAKRLEGTNIRTVILRDNQIDEQMQDFLKKEYSTIEWIFEKIRNDENYRRLYFF
ncbi:MAG: hypothetical protein BGO68_04590 [Candidatus Amoebophilus sp. 36-38]|nr:MAG: hypothetical protein BGO68_04590 [Candidatus Amoebophilus sp. 36-38]